MRNKTKKQFVKNIGKCFLNGIGVFKYTVGELVQVSIENTRSKTLAFEVMPPEKYEELEEKWTAGCHGGDARIVQRALKYFGMWAEEGEDE